MIVLDTDVLSIVQRADGPSYQQLVLRLDAADDEVAVCIVSFEEQMRGWLAYVARAKSSNQQIEGYARLHEGRSDLTTDKTGFTRMGRAEGGGGCFGSGWKGM